MTMMASTNFSPMTKASNVDKTLGQFGQIDGLMDTLGLLDNSNIRTVFKQAKDPINLAFDHIDNQPLKKVAKDFVTGAVCDFLEFITGIFE